MDPFAERDPLFETYRAAWQAYLALQAQDPAGAIPYTRAVTESPDPVLRAAATDLAAARDAWLTDSGG